jgi:hypothetical protein
MPDPAKHVVASVRYEIRVISGPHAFQFRGETVAIGKDDDIVVLMRITMVRSMATDQTIVGIIGDQWRTGSFEFLHLRNFLSAGGVIGLNRDLV